ncbi:conserved hypothetical protein [Leishmania major strain Friedlin]|uniref:Uncharacterized protein n=1 Tax=Leishmania major TaxID=5664 RepID=Q4QHQ2_LEIMA|nr:conserved hypothetical protein [Leishmania major strain Friedlin]CAG9569739.1 hypothetical_protein_-__conserved [Leishmania major strain Friedlin]CAJ02960.1 conserved hypothetical protein [Leishmania major strain Friedlin]|eukprot:XP_001681296.1 conserved hypothetical protein [Leishmania major strain Friedlin]
MSDAPHRQSSTPASSFLPPEPLCVADILSELLPFLLAAPQPRDGCPPSSSAQEPAESPVLLIPPTVASEHRVQVSIRGRRYETALEVALTYSLFFFVFFHWPFSEEDESSDAAGCASDVAHVKRAPRSVGDAVMAAASARDLPKEAHLLRHYTRVVEPVLRVFLDHWAAPLDAAAAAQGEGESAARAETAEAGDAARLPLLPPLPHPVRIAYDASTRVWKFEFAARLTAGAAAEARSGRQCDDSSAAVSLAAADGCAAVATDKLNNSPFLLLQSEYMGLLLVFLRRCAKVRAERRAAGEGAAACALAPYPSLPIRWEEMNYDEQLSVVQLIRRFGVVSLARTYTRPTAPETTSLYIGEEAAAATARVKVEGDACSLRARASESMGKQQQKIQQAASVAVDTAEVVKKERCINEDDFDGLVLSAKGCARCGMAEHSTEECHF